jgi:hypothetical protein
MPGSLTKPIDPDGPLVTVRIAITWAHEQLLISRGDPVPFPVGDEALLDTGTSMTVISDDITRVLALPLRGTRTVRSSLTGSQSRPARVFEVRLAIMIGPTVLHEWPKVPVLEAAFPGQDPYHVLIGRDLLDDCVFTYDGKRRTFTLDI